MYNVLCKVMVKSLIWSLLSGGPNNIGSIGIHTNSYYRYMLNHSCLKKRKNHVFLGKWSNTWKDLNKNRILYPLIVSWVIGKLLVIANMLSIFCRSKNVLENDWKTNKSKLLIIIWGSSRNAMFSIFFNSISYNQHIKSNCFRNAT